MPKKRIRITKIVVDELSTVDRAANGKCFLLYKRAGTTPIPDLTRADSEAVSRDLASFVKSDLPTEVRVAYDMSAVKRLLTPGL